MLSYPDDAVRPASSRSNRTPRTEDELEEDANTEHFPQPIEPFTEQIPPIKVLGEGTFGQVLKYVVKSEPIAVKMSKIRDTLDHNSLNDVSILKTLNHPNVIKILNAGWHDNIMYIVMPCADATLEDVLNNWDRLQYSHIDPKELTVMLTTAVAYIHSRDIMHRDIKPANVLFFERRPSHYTVKLADFGGSCAMVCVKDIMLGSITTTLEYQSPEILYGDNSYRQEVDVWALACTIYSIYTRTILFPFEYGDQMVSIFVKLGAPPKEAYAGLPKSRYYQSFSVVTPDEVLTEIDNADLRDLLLSMLRYTERITAATAIITHPFFADHRPPENYYPMACHEVLEKRAFPYGPVDCGRAMGLLKNMLLHMSHTMNNSYRIYIFTVDVLHTLCGQPISNPDYFTYTQGCVQPTKLLGVAAFFLAGVYIDPLLAPHESDIITYMSKHKIPCNFTVVDIQTCARDIITHLSFDLMRTTSYDFYFDLAEHYPDINNHHAMDMLKLLSLSSMFDQRISNKLAALFILCLQTRLQHMKMLTAHRVPELSELYHDFIRELEQSYRSNVLFGLVPTAEYPIMVSVPSVSTFSWTRLFTDLKLVMRKK